MSARSTPVSGGEVNPYGHLWLTVQLVGEGRRGSHFSRGVSQHPTVHDRAHIVTEADLRTIYGAGELIDFVQVGHLASAESIPALVDITKLVTRHSAVVGTTGAGKSHTVAGILHALADKDNYQFFRTVEMTRAHGLVCRHCGSRSVAPCEEARAELGLREAARRLQDIRNRGQTRVRPVGVREIDR